LLEYLELGTLLEDILPFDETNPFFQATVATLCQNVEKEVLHHIYDHLFIEILKQIKALPQINANFLLHVIKKKEDANLASYEAALIENPSHAMHDLILYLAWDRMCVWMARLFNHQSTNPTFIRGLDVLKECLIESYQHIKEQGRTSPGIYRMLEALFFYEMREENLQKHSPDEWAMLTQSFPILKGENELVDFFYIDDLISSEGTSYLTLDSPDKVKARFTLAEYLINKIKEATPTWNYVLHPKEITHLKG
jgi:hypothetical protein